jgi:hypothetical protein
VSGANEEIYSIMFSSLKHPARRKILRILSNKPMIFSEMLELLQISSSNLTYHLENLGELITKDESGAYKLSTFGVASVNTMEIVEDAPPIQPKQRLALPFKWKTIFTALLIGLITLASITYLQFGTLNRLSDEQEILQSKYNQLVSWSGSANSAISFLENVTQIDVSKYQATLLSRTVEYRSDLGGTVEEIMRYSLTSSDSKMDVVFRFRNNRLSKYQIIMLEGTSIYSNAQPYSVLDTAKTLLERFRVFDDSHYLENMSSILALVNRMENIEIKEANIKLIATFNGDNARILMIHTDNEVDFSPKSLNLIFENQVLKELTDGYFLFTTGSTSVNISNERAVQIAKNALNGFSWSANGQTVSNFNVLSEPVSVIFHPNTKETLALYPQWTVTFYLDKVYPGEVNKITITLWADNGEIAQIKTQIN